MLCGRTQTQTITYCMSLYAEQGKPETQQISGCVEMGERVRVSFGGSGNVSELEAVVALHCECIKCF